MRMRKLTLLGCGALGLLLLSGCGQQAETEDAGTVSGDNVVNVYNWGEYIDPDVIDMFEEETGIKVVYDMFETNEEMYPVIQAGGVVYDAVCPSGGEDDPERPSGGIGLFEDSQYFGNRRGIRGHVPEV